MNFVIGIGKMSLNEAGAAALHYINVTTEDRRGKVRGTNVYLTREQLLETSWNATRISGTGDMPGSPSMSVSIEPAVIALWGADVVEDPIHIISILDGKTGERFRFNFPKMIYDQEVTLETTNLPVAYRSCKTWAMIYRNCSGITRIFSNGTNDLGMHYFASRCVKREILGMLVIEGDKFIKIIPAM